MVIIIIIIRPLGATITSPKCALTFKNIIYIMLSSSFYVII